MLNKLFIIFLEGSIDKMEDKDLYLLWKTYSQKKRLALVKGKIHDYENLSRTVNILKNEMLSRVEGEN